MSDEEEIRTVHPFKLINRGEDTVVGEDNNVIFSDFSPRVIPSDVPDEEIDDLVSPKDVSAREPAPSPELPPPTEPTLSETTVPAPVDKGDGKKSQDATSSPSSSIDPKSGHEEQPA